MYCTNCGDQFLDDCKFCPSCGSLTNSIDFQGTDFTKISDKEEIDRQMIISHLLDLRTLEFASNSIHIKIQDLTNRINRLCIPTNINIKPKKNTLTSVIFGLLILIFSTPVLVLLLTTLSELVLGIDAYNPNILQREYLDRSFMIFLLIVSALISSVIAFIPYIKSKKRYKKETLDYRKNTEFENNRIAQEERERDKLQKDLANYNAEHQKATSVLQQVYLVNIVPLQFRNIYGVYFLYDYLSTSRESFQSALMHYNLNEIKMKLDNVIANQEDMISMQYIQFAKLDMLSSQNKQLVQIAESIDNNAQVASRYAGIAAANTQALAYFKLSEYFRQT